MQDHFFLFQIMYEERCFICGGRMGKGMHPSLGPQEKIDKLVSVSRNVSHTSTIICDILSRILNETVMEDESICKICFNLLNDIDYHLKEAQEKTDEVTNKFLDKNRENKYVEQQSSMVEEILPETRSEHKSKKRVSSPPKKHSVFMPHRNHHHHHHEDHDVNLTEDEMSVNSINKNKAKLLSHVLNPKMKSKMIQKQQKEEENQTPMPMPVPTPTTKSSKKGSNKRPISKRYIASSSESEDEINDEESDHELVNVKKKSKKDELTTVNMEDLGDLFSKPNMYYAKKSSPKKAVNIQDPIEGDRDPITCELCKKTFKKLINLQLHLEKVHEINSKPVVLEQENPPESYKCLQCTREFVSEEALMKHVDEHINEKAKPVEKKPVARNLQPAKDNEVKATCPQCNQTFRRLFNLKTHINRVHNKVKPYKCDKCDKAFATNSDLKQHLNTHGEGKLFKCDLCDRT